MSEEELEERLEAFEDELTELRRIVRDVARATIANGQLMEVWHAKLKPLLTVAPSPTAMPVPPRLEVLSYPSRDESERCH